MNNCAATHTIQVDSELAPEHSRKRAGLSATICSSRSLRAYNRGYNEGIKLDGTQVGNITLANGTDPQALSASFRAVLQPGTARLDSHRVSRHGSAGSPTS